MSVTVSWRLRIPVRLNIDSGVHRTFPLALITCSQLPAAKRPIGSLSRRPPTQIGRSRAQLPVRLYVWLLVGPRKDKLPSEQGVASEFFGANVYV